MTAKHDASSTRSQCSRDAVQPNNNADCQDDKASTHVGELSKAMIVEEARLQKEAEKIEARQRKSHAKDELSRLEHSARHLRLKFLIDRSKVYTSILSEKLLKQQEASRARGTHTSAMDGSTQPKVEKGVSSSNRSSAYHIAEYIDAGEFGAKQSTRSALRDASRSEDAEEGPRTVGVCGASGHERTRKRQPELITGGYLKDYQLSGVEWLVSLYENGLNGILADEMGLGKTLQTIAFLAFLREKGVVGPYLVCAPLSTIANWVKEFRRFAPKIPVLLYHGDKAARADMRKLHKFNSKVDEDFPVIVTSYEIVMHDRKYLQNLHWKYIVVDEGHRLKNLNCRLIRELKSYSTANRLLLTGTPLQNNLTELWSLLNFLLPDIFSDLESFQSWFDFSSLEANASSSDRADMVIDDDLVSNLHHILKPFLLRRLKIDVEHELPPKREYLLYAPLTRIQKEMYRDALQKSASAYSTVEQDDEGSEVREDELSLGPEGLSGTRLKLVNRLMYLRKVCNHPYQIEWPVQTGTEKYVVDESLVLRSGKMLLLRRLLQELFRRNHKVLVFSQFTSMLDIIEVWSEDVMKWQICRIDGNTGQDARQKMIDDFNSTSSAARLFLLSTRAGGLGISLTASDTVILFDSDWNPQNDLQAMDRAHRIGQKKPVIVYRLVTANTIEQALIDRATNKRRLEKIVISKNQFKSILQSSRLAGKELAQILTDDDAEHIRTVEEPNRDRDGMQTRKRKRKSDASQSSDIDYPQILSDEELAVLLDRSESAYKRAVEKPDMSDNFASIETAGLNEGDKLATRI
ncbi:Putative ATPase [Savitreella phatthalungensis]